MIGTSLPGTSFGPGKTGRQLVYETPSVVYIPDYLSSALDTSTLINIAGIGFEMGKKVYASSIENRKAIVDIFNNKLSKYDIISFISINQYLYKLVNNANPYDMNNLVEFLTNGELNDYATELYYGNKEYLDVLNILKSSNTMSENKNNIYNFIHADGVIFVILHEGFSNLVIDSKEGLQEFREDLLNSMYSNFNDEQVNSTKLFKTFLKTK